MFTFDIFVSVFILFGPNIIKKFNFFQTYLFFKAVYTSHTLMFRIGSMELPVMLHDKLKLNIKVNRFDIDIFVLTNT